MTSVWFQGKPLNIIVIQVYASTRNAEEAEVEQFFEDLQDIELTPQKDVLFIKGDWNAKVESQEIPGITGKIWPWSTAWRRAKVNRILPSEHTGHRKHTLPTTQEKTLHMDIIRRSILKLDWLYSLQSKMEKFYVKWSEVKVAQSCPTLCDPTNYKIHGILQARILEWVSIPFSRGSSQSRDQTQVSLIAGGFHTSWANREALCSQCK